MSAIDKTQSLQRLEIPVDQLFVNDLNPNKMSDAEFNMLYDNIERMGITDAILVRPVGDKYRIVGGAHRFEVAKLIGFETVPCTVVTDPEFDEDQEKFQIVRMNVIRGKMTPDSFMKLYESLSEKYTDEVLKDSFGFVEEQEFRKLVKTMADSLPKDMQKEFKQAAEEIKTIDGLATLLNSMFGKYGDSLPYGYMLIDFGKKDSIWLRMDNVTYMAMLDIGTICRKESRTMDDLLGGLVRMIAAGDLDEQLLQLIAKSKPVEIPENYVGLPLKEVLEG